MHAVGVNVRAAQRTAYLRSPCRVCANPTHRQTERDEGTSTAVLLAVCEPHVQQHIVDVTKHHAQVYLSILVSLTLIHHPLGNSNME